MTKRTEAQETAIGQVWAEILMLKRSPKHKDRYQLTTGDKTALGIYRTLCSMTSEETAAPDLLTALKDALGWLENSDVQYLISHKLGEQAEIHRTINGAKAIIAKAKGR